jgi:hypothetical protein
MLAEWGQNGGRRWQMAGKKGQRMPPRNLADYRWVYKNPTGETDSPMRKILQGLLAKDAGKFLDRLEREERAFREAKPVAGKDADKVDDDGGLELVEQWIKERKERDDALARRTA